MNTYNIGPLTMEYVFRAAELENMSDMQAVMDAVEAALEMKGLDVHAVARDFIVTHEISCAEATAEDRVFVNAPVLVEQLAEIVGYYEYPEDDD